MGVSNLGRRNQVHTREGNNKIGLRTRWNVFVDVRRLSSSPRRIVDEDDTVSGRRQLRRRGDGRRTRRWPCGLRPPWSRRRSPSSSSSVRPPSTACPSPNCEDMSATSRWVSQFFGFRFFISSYRFASSLFLGEEPSIVLVRFVGFDGALVSLDGHGPFCSTRFDSISRSRSNENCCIIVCKPSCWLRRLPKPAA